jgi:hypothetical protein
MDYKHRPYMFEDETLFYQAQARKEGKLEELNFELERRRKQIYRSGSYTVLEKDVIDSTPKTIGYQEISVIEVDEEEDNNVDDVNMTTESDDERESYEERRK